MPTWPAWPDRRRAHVGPNLTIAATMCKGERRSAQTQSKQEMNFKKKEKIGRKKWTVRRAHWLLLCHYCRRRRRRRCYCCYAAATAYANNNDKHVGKPLGRAAVLQRGAVMAWQHDNMAQETLARYFSLFFVANGDREERTHKQHLAGYLHNGLLALTGEKGTRHAKARRGKRKKADKKREQHRIRKKLLQEKNGRKRTRRAAVGREVSLCGTPPPTLLVVALLSCPRNWSLPSLVSFFVSTSHEAEIPMGAQKAQRPLVKKGSMQQCAEAFFFSVYPDCSVPQTDQEKEGQTKRARTQYARL